MKNEIDKIIIRIGKTVLHRNFYHHKKVYCPICNREIQPYWEPRYNGVRATCSACGTNWQES